MEQVDAKVRLKNTLRPLYHGLYRLRVRTVCRYLDCVEGLFGPEKELPVPPALLRFRVAEDANLTRFVEIGRLSAERIEAALAGIGRTVGDFGTALDFGCGCGRTLRWLMPRFPGTRFSGTDVDGEAVSWCQKHLQGGDFRTSAPQPPLGFPPKNFDFIFAISVFTHLDAAAHEEWVPELARVLKPGGILLATFHGPAAWEHLTGQPREQIEKDRFLFATSRKLRGIVPEWYHTAYHTPDYVRDLLSRRFELLDYVQGGFGYQDIALARRPLDLP